MEDQVYQGLLLLLLYYKVQELLNQKRKKIYQRVQQTTTTQSTTIPETTTAEEAAFNVNWETCIAETKEELTDTEFFSYVKEIGIFINEEEKEITFSASLDDATDPAVALDFADTLIRRFNLSARSQDSTIKSGEKDYYGGIYDTYSIMIGIAPYSKTDDYKEWFIYDAVAVGAHTKIKLQSKQQRNIHYRYKL